LFRPVAPIRSLCLCVRGTCTNTASLPRSHLESLGDRYAAREPDGAGRCPEFVAEFTKEWNRLAAERYAARAHDQTRLSTIQRKIDKLVEALMEGFRSEEIKQQPEALS